MEAAIENRPCRKTYLRLLPFASSPTSGLYRPDQRQLRRPDDARRPWHVRHGLRLRRRHVYWDISSSKCPATSSWKVGARPWIAHHDHLGHLRRPDRPGDRFPPVCRRALPAWCRRSRLLPGIVYFTYWFGASPWTHRLGLPDRLPIAVAGRRADLHRTSRAGACGACTAGNGYIAEAVPTILIGIVTFFVLTDRPEQATF